MIKVLHFSDLHIHENYDQNKVLERFIQDIQNKNFDLVICSGDIVAKGSYSNRESVINFFEKIKEVLGAAIPIIICPGNHDINLKSRKPIYNSIFNITTVEQANDLFDSINGDQDYSLLAHLNDYSNLVKSITGKDLENKLFFSEMFSIDNKKIGIATLNSAWLTKGGGDQDYGKLFISPRQLERSLDELEGCDLKIVVLHHPLDWLSPMEKTIIQNILTNQVNILFCGHMHTTSVSHLSSNIGSLFVSNTGCIYQNRNYFNGYTILEINDESIKTIAREYYDERAKFGPSIRFSDDSTVTFSLKKKIVA